MKYVLDKDGKIIVGPKGGIMIDVENGSEPYELDVTGVEKTIAELRAEAKEHRQKKAEYKAIVESLPEEIIKNPKAAQEALTVVASLGDKHKMDMEKLKGELTKSFESAHAEKDKKIGELQGQIFNEKVTSRFATSKALEKTIFNKTREVAISHFKSHFTVDENGNMIGKFKDGAMIYSKTNPGKPADFDECIESIINNDPNKESYLAPTGQQGTGHRDTGKQFQGETRSTVDKISAGLKARQNQ